MSGKADTIAAVCEALASGDAQEAIATLRRDYSFASVLPAERKYREAQALAVFRRDGFIDRYSGDKLVFPGTLRLLALRLPVDFPFHPNWKMSQTHPAFWELSPTIDHVVPVARGGADAESNWVTTSMRRNSLKSNWSLDELGWTLHPPGALHEWDGMLGWFTRYVTEHPDVLSTPLIQRWHRAAQAV